MKTHISFRIKLFILFLLLSSPCLLYAQTTPKIEWQKCYGGSGGETVPADGGRSIIQTSDGGYAFCGYTQSHEGDVSGHHGDSTNVLGDAWVVKINSFGVIQWQKCLGGTKDDRASCIIQTSDKGYAIAGFTYSTDGDLSKLHVTPGGDAWIIKLDSLGNIEWQFCFGASITTQLYDPGYAFSIIQTSNDEYLVAGLELFGEEGCNNLSVNSANAFILRLDPSGNVIWSGCYGGSGLDDAYSAVQTADSGFIFAGSTTSNDGDVSGYHSDSMNTNTYDSWLVKLNAYGSY